MAFLGLCMLPTCHTPHQVKRLQGQAAVADAQIAMSGGQTGEVRNDNVGTPPIRTVTKKCQIHHSRGWCVSPSSFVPGNGVLQRLGVSPHSWCDSPLTSLFKFQRHQTRTKPTLTTCTGTNCQVFIVARQVVMYIEFDRCSSWHTGTCSSHFSRHLPTGTTVTFSKAPRVILAMCGALSKSRTRIKAVGLYRGIVALSRPAHLDLAVSWLGQQGDGEQYDKSSTSCNRCLTIDLASERPPHNVPAFAPFVCCLTCLFGFVRPGFRHDSNKT